MNLASVAAQWGVDFGVVSVLVGVFGAARASRKVCDLAGNRMKISMGRLRQDRTLSVIDSGCPSRETFVASERGART